MPPGFTPHKCPGSSKTTTAAPPAQLAASYSQVWLVLSQGWAWEQRLIAALISTCCSTQLFCCIRSSHTAQHLKVSNSMAHCIKGTSRRQADVQHCSYCFDVLIAQLTRLEGPPPDFEDGNWYVTSKYQRMMHADSYQLPAQTAWPVWRGVSTNLLLLLARSQPAVCDLDQGRILGQARPATWLHRHAGAPQAAHGAERLCAHKVGVVAGWLICHHHPLSVCTCAVCHSLSPFMQCLARLPLLPSAAQGGGAPQLLRLAAVLLRARRQLARLAGRHARAHHRVH